MLTFDVDTSVFDRVIGRIDATTGQIEQARTSALRKMRSRFETMVKKAAAKKLRMPQKAISDRFFSNRIEPGDDELRLWVGTWAVSPFSIGSVSLYGVPGKTGGVKAGRRTYRGAFLASIYTGQEKVWIRLHSQHYAPELYPTQHRPGDNGLAGMRGRFPVVRAAVPIDEVIAGVLEQEGDAMLAEFEKVFAQELNYYANVKGRA